MFAMASQGASPKVSYDQLVSWGYSLMTMHFTAWGAIKGMKQLAKLCYEAKSDIPVTDDPEIDARPIALFEMFGLHDWLQLGSRFNQKIHDAAEWNK